MNQNDHPHLYKVIADYDSPYTEPFFLKKGEKVQVGRRDTEWPGWVWCTNAAGESRWVPEATLHSDGSTGQAACAYESTELSVTVGEQLAASHEESGWLWCTNRSGQSGWVPRENLARDEGAYL